MRFILYFLKYLEFMNYVLGIEKIEMSKSYLINYSWKPSRDCS